VSVAEFENMFWLFAVAGKETLRNGLPGAVYIDQWSSARGLIVR
jgi:hypothetical protein